MGAVVAPAQHAPPDSIGLCEGSKLLENFCFGGGFWDHGGDVFLAEVSWHRLIHQLVERTHAQSLQHQCFGGLVDA
ncbi:MAG: Uncharacterised protein [Cellulomonadaceae bacterium TMED98]|nr:MAG: Uncharacterised protein [Cellulomonadaceae bacterium TMED98]